MSRRGVHAEHVRASTRRTRIRSAVLGLPLVYDGLVGLRRTGGAAGLTLVPDLAGGSPRPSPDGLEYAFTLRRGIQYSNGEEVTPEDIRRGLQQELTVSDDAGRLANIVGAPECIRVKTACDLSHGVEVDDQTYRIAIHLRSPDPDFLYKLTEPLFATPVGDPGRPATTLRPATGPYMIGATATSRFTFVRNPYFHPWSVAAQPEGYPDTIEWTSRDRPDRGGPQRPRRNSGRRPAGSGRHRVLHLADAQARSVPIRTSARGSSTCSSTPRSAPFDNPDVRKSINFAVDRDKVVELVGGESFGSPTCQILPPNLPGYRQYCPYTANPSTGRQLPRSGPAQGRSSWSSRSGTRGMEGHGDVDYVEDPSALATAKYVVGVLNRLGYRARFALSIERQLLLGRQSRRRWEIGALCDGLPAALGRDRVAALWCRQLPGTTATQAWTGCSLALWMIERNDQVRAAPCVGGARPRAHR